MKPEKSDNRTARGMRDALKKATTEMLVLFLLRQKPMYTYQMAQEVERLTKGVLTYNTMYLAVYRLQSNGYICETEKRIEDGRARTGEQAGFNQNVGHAVRARQAQGLHC